MHHYKGTHLQAAAKGTLSKTKLQNVQAVFGKKLLQSRLVEFKEPQVVTYARLKV